MTALQESSSDGNELMVAGGACALQPPFLQLSRYLHDFPRGRGLRAAASILDLRGRRSQFGN
ncbi:MAG: hypothetical protein ACE5EF_14780, partial [Dehalococcoidia bacterium]